VGKLNARNICTSSLQLPFLLVLCTQAALWDPTSPRPARARAAILFELGRHDEAVIRVEVKDQPFVELC